MRVLIVLVALRVPLGRLGPLFPEEQLVVDDGAGDGPADDGAAFDGDDGVPERGRELVRGREGGEGQGEEQESALAPGGAVFVVPGPDGLDPFERQFAREEEVQVVLELAQAVSRRRCAGFARERSDGRVGSCVGGGMGCGWHSGRVLRA